MEASNPEPAPLRPIATFLSRHAWNAALALLCLAILLALRLFVVQPYVVSGDSMRPTLKDGRLLLVSPLTYRFRAPKRGDIIVFRYPYAADRSQQYEIKRIIGLPGETVTIAGNATLIATSTDSAGAALPEPYVSIEGPARQGSLKLGPNEFFVMGDNRSQNSDSRAWGALDKSFIVGPILFR